MKKRNKYEILAFISQGRPTIQELNPRIKNIVIDEDFSDNFEYAIKKPYSIELKPSDKAFYAIDCINPSCTKGFFDISNDLFSLLKDSKSSISGVLSCDGWQDERRIGNHRCLARVKYSIRAIFNDE
jgi:hypothetical protein